MLDLAKSILDAQEVYYLATGTFAAKVSSLNIDIPRECTHINFPYYDESDKGEIFKCGNDFLLNNSTPDNRIAIDYCPGKNTAWNECTSVKDFQIDFYGAHNQNERANRRFCRRNNNSNLGSKVCASFAGFDKWE